VIINKLCYSTTRLLNEFSAILARKDLVDSTTQTDFKIHNNVGVKKIGGLKLNIIITESNILSKVQSNNQAIEQINKWSTKSL
jgi:hypothetical protein